MIHNHEVRGSIPRPATVKIRGLHENVSFFLFLCEIIAKSQDYIIRDQSEFLWREK